MSINLIILSDHPLRALSSIDTKLERLDIELGVRIFQIRKMLAVLMKKYVGFTSLSSEHNTWSHVLRLEFIIIVYKCCNFILCLVIHAH